VAAAADSRTVVMQVEIEVEVRKSVRPHSSLFGQLMRSACAKAARLEAQICTQMVSKALMAAAGACRQGWSRP
jgi:hypothetical protein